MDNDFEVMIVGGGAAGLSAAVMLGRSCRSVLVIDAGRPRNAPATGVHGFLTRDGMPPGQLVRAGRVEVESYGGQVRTGTVTGARRTDSGFEVSIDDGTTVTGRRILVSSGVTDELPPVAGLAARWGRDVVHCPYCHGWEVRDRRIGVLASGPMAVHQALLFHQLSGDVALFTNTERLPAEQLEQVSAVGIELVEGLVERVQVTDDRISGLCLIDGRVVRVGAVAVSTTPIARSAVLDDLGVVAQPHPMGAAFGQVYPSSGAAGATSRPGVFVAGNVSNTFGQVITAAGEGAMAGAAINADLIAEDTAAAVERRQATGSVPFVGWAISRWRRPSSNAAGWRRSPRLRCTS